MRSVHKRPVETSEAQLQLQLLEVEQEMLAKQKDRLFNSAEYFAPPGWGALTEV